MPVSAASTSPRYKNSVHTLDLSLNNIGDAGAVRISKNPPKNATPPPQTPLPSVAKTSSPSNALYPQRPVHPGAPFWLTRPCSLAGGNRRNNAHEHGPRGAVSIGLGVNFILFDRFPRDISNPAPAPALAVFGVANALLVVSICMAYVRAGYSGLGIHPSWLGFFSRFSSPGLH